ncbi:MAG: ATP-binding protein [Lentisphaeria bacterium]|nr:ATP-binding protein [Lentisphaeria bacterium]
MNGSANLNPLTTEISMPPLPSVLLESLRNIGYTIETALADIVDNSITASASKVSVRFLWEGGNPWVAIADDACGMSEGELRSAMRFGSTPPTAIRNKEDLGRFGLGMKTASISQCRRVTVCSKVSGILSACEWNLDRISEDHSTGWMLGVMSSQAIAQDLHLASLVESLLDGVESGTIVLWRTLDTTLAGTEKVDSERKFSELMDNARHHLETVFHRFLSPDPGCKRVSIDFNTSILQGFNPFGPAIPARQELPSEKIRIEGEEINIQPFILPHRNKVSREEYDLYAGEGGYLQNQGFYVYRNKRLIVKATWFRLIKKEEMNKLIRVRIDIPNSLDHMWRINVNKSQVTAPEIVRKQLKNIINRISGRGKRVFKRRATVLKGNGKIAIWNREVRESKVTYSINHDHPLVADIIDQIPMNLRHRLESSLRMIADSFPLDIYYNDVANDEVDVHHSADENTARELCQQMVQALKKCGIIGEDLKKRLLGTEIPGVTEEMIGEVLEKEEEICKE